MAVQTTAPRPVPPPLRHPESDSDPLLQLVGDVHTAHTLIIAPHSLDLMCGLLRRGCPAATALRQSAKPDMDSYDLVVAELELGRVPPEALVQRIRGALAHKGRLVARLAAGPAAAGFIRRLRLNGFS